MTDTPPAKPLGFWEQLQNRLDTEPDFRREYEAAAEWIAETDRLVNEIPDRRTTP